MLTLKFACAIILAMVINLGLTRPQRCCDPCEAWICLLPCVCVLTAGLDKLPRLVSPMPIALMRQRHAGWIEPAWRGPCNPFKWGRGSGFLCVFVCFSLGCSCMRVLFVKPIGFWTLEIKGGPCEDQKGKVFSHFSLRYSSSLRPNYTTFFLCHFFLLDRSNSHLYLTSISSWFWRMGPICVMICRICAM